MPTNEPDIPSILDSSKWTRECAAQHFGDWMIEPNWFSRAVAAVKDGSYRAAHSKQSGMVSDPDEPRARTDYINHRGIAVIPIQGPTMKARSKFGGTSSVDVRAALRKAASDDAIDSILLHIDSPGGTVAGAFELAKDIASIDRTVKPIHAHIEDLGASAGYLFASQARRITADATSQVGCIGVVTSLVDSTGQLSKDGIKIEIISTGGLKGAGIDGRVTDDMREEAQKHVDELGEHFLAAVKSGRSMSEARVRALMDGRVHIAAEAKTLGLIDAVMSLDAAVGSIIETKNAGESSPAIITHEPKQPEAPARAETQKVQPHQESPAMPDPIQPTATPAPAATPVVPTSANLAGSDLKPLNDLAVQRYINEGRAIGAKEEREVQRDRIDRIVALCDGRPAMALAAIRDGQSVEAVKLSVEAVKQAEAIAQKQIEELQARNLRAEQLLAIGGVSGGVSASLAAAGVDLDSPVDPKMRAETEWDRNPDLRNKFSSKDRYVAIRVAELSGKFRIKSA